MSRLVGELTITLDHGDTTVGRGNLDPTQFPHVSRQQATLHRTASGVVTLESLGRNVTGWRSAGGASWEWLVKGRKLALSIGDKIALDKKLSDGCIFTLLGPEEEAPAVPMAAAPTAAAVASPPAPSSVVASPAAAVAAASASPAAAAPPAASATA